MLDGNPSPQEFAEKTIVYAEAKTAYFEALSATMPELRKNANQEDGSPKLEAFAAAFAIAREERYLPADETIRARFKQFPPSAQLQQARLEFEHRKRLRTSFGTTLS